MYIYGPGMAENFICILSANGGNNDLKKGEGGNKILNVIFRPLQNSKETFKKLDSGSTTLALRIHYNRKYRYLQNVENIMKVTHPSKTSISRLVANPLDFNLMDFFYI